MKNIATFLVAAALLTGCSKKEADPQPAPAPAQAATIDVVFNYYATGNEPASTQSMSLLADRPSWKKTADRLTLTLDKQSVVNTLEDQVEVVIPLNKQKAGLVGTYVLASQPNTTAGDAMITYLRPGSSSTYPNYYGSNTNQVAGTLVITSYDAQRQLISGRYSAQFTNVKGPYSYLELGSAGDPRRDGDLAVSGTFTEVPMK